MRKLGARTLLRMVVSCSEGPGGLLCAGGLVDDIKEYLDRTNTKPHLSAEEQRRKYAQKKDEINKRRRKWREENREIINAARRARYAEDQALREKDSQRRKKNRK